MIYKKGNELKIGIAGEYFAMYYFTVNGFDVAKTEQGSQSDIFLDIKHKILRIQVKTTLNYTKIDSYNVCRFSNRHGKSNRRAIYEYIDIFCYVCLATQEIAFIEAKNIPQCIEFYSNNEKNNTNRYSTGLKIDEAIKHYKENKNISPTLLSKMFNVPVSSIRSRIKKGTILTNELENLPKTFNDYGIDNLKKIINKYEK
jgi:hypothetical protein